MPLTFESEGEIGVFRSVGKVEFAEGMRVFEEGLREVADREPAVARIRIELLESGENRSSGELRAIAGMAKKHFTKARMALVADKALYLGLSRMFGVFAEDLGLEVEVFSTNDEANQWLNQEAS